MADLELEERPRPLRKLLWASLGVGIAGVLVFLGWTVLSGKPVTRAKVPPPVQLVELPPPPPPPPPPPEPKVEEIEPPEPIPNKVEIPDPAPVKQEAPPEPQQQADAPPGPEGLDAEGEAGSDSFGLRGTPGGRGFFGDGGGGGGGGGYGDYVAGLLKRAIESDPELRRGAAFTVDVQLALAADGRIEGVTIKRSSGNPALDDRVRQVVAGVGRVEPRRDAPPVALMSFTYQGRRA